MRPTATKPNSGPHSPPRVGLRGTRKGTSLSVLPSTYGNDATSTLVIDFESLRRVALVVKPIFRRQRGERAAESGAGEDIADIRAQLDQSSARSDGGVSTDRGEGIPVEEKPGMTAADGDVDLQVKEVPR